jgi:large subunit ribosomal protein L35
VAVLDAEKLNGTETGSDRGRQTRHPRMVHGHVLLSRRANDKTGTKPPVAERSSKMPKMKTKSSAKKRFKITATGKVKVQAAGKRHGMIKRTNKFIRDARGTTVLSDPDAKIIKKFMPNGGGI